MIGTGSAGSRHLNNLHSLGYTDLHALRSQPGGYRSSLDGVQFCNHYDLSSALAQKPDIAVIANPTSLHIPVALAAAEEGCHLLLEKPVSNSLNRIEELLATVRRQNLVAAVGYNLRFHPAMQMLREMVERKEVGDILSVRVWVGQYLPDWHPGEDYRSSYVSKSELGGGVILTLSHEIDCLFCLFGEVAEVTAVTGRAKNRKWKLKAWLKSHLCSVTGYSVMSTSIASGARPREEWN